MADRTVKVAIIGDTSSLNRAMKDGADATDKFGGVFANISQGVITKGAALGFFIADAAMQVGQAMAQMAADAALWLPKLGAEFDNAADKIRVSVGDNPLLNMSLGESFENVYKTTASGMDATSTAIAVLYQRLGVTGPQLEDLSKQMLDLSRITGTDAVANVDALSKAFVNWNVPAEGMSGLLDVMFRASQETGTSVGDLAKVMADAGPVLRGLGFSVEDSVALLSGLAEAGVDAGDAMPYLNKALAEAAKAGVPAQEFFADFIKELQNTDDVTAMGRAVEVLGARAGPKFAQAVKDGRLEFEDLLGVIMGGSDTIAGATGATDDWQEKWSIFWHEIQIAAKPAADWIFQTLGDITTAFQEGGIAAAWDVVLEKWRELKTNLKTWWDDTFQPWWDETAYPWITDVLIPGLQSGFSDWVDGVWEGENENEGLRAKLVRLFEDITVWMATDGAQMLIVAGMGLGAAIGIGLLRMADVLRAQVGLMVINLVTSFATWLWEGITNAFAGVARWLAENVRKLMPDIPGVPGPRAVGGPVTSGMPYIVGERGPELFVPGQSGTIVPNDRLGSMGSSGGTMVAKVYLDGKQIAQAIAKREMATR